MTLKRKLDLDTELSNDCIQVAKQLKLVPFPGYEADTDVAMSDSPSSDLDLFFPENHHSRLVSTASTASSSSLSSSLFDAVDYNSPLYPRLSAQEPTLDPCPTDSPKVIGLLQPTSSFAHHGSDCSQIPKLRVACSASPDGSRTMWSFCEQCGAISMVDTD
ncbi:hypothetical protein SCLCIDRAFT_722522 [Scleroderma citrinum Foug A]|uniref:Uncharacterized protein n=1 Tax=Scleroderma citrinum Foug A TaxID=1036808 RepID=A0A0C3EPH0_9AGAM|nr:hypothetical protein SCLCIDRAFT_722522 [Scleroderma citrinum Foug A]